MIFWKEKMYKNIIFWKNDQSDADIGIEINFFFNNFFFFLRSIWLFQHLNTQETQLNGFIKCEKCEIN